jgi:hypothetical protein
MSNSARMPFCDAVARHAKTRAASAAIHGAAAATRARMSAGAAGSSRQRRAATSAAAAPYPAAAAPEGTSGNGAAWGSNDGVRAAAKPALTISAPRPDAPPQICLNAQGSMFDMPE